MPSGSRNPPNRFQPPPYVQPNFPWQTGPTHTPDIGDWIAGAHYAPPTAAADGDSMDRWSAVDTAIQDELSIPTEFLQPIVCLPFTADQLTKLQSQLVLNTSRNRAWRVLVDLEWTQSESLHHSYELIDSIIRLPDKTQFSTVLARPQHYTLSSGAHLPTLYPPVHSVARVEVIQELTQSPLFASPGVDILESVRNQTLYQGNVAFPEDYKRYLTRAEESRDSSAAGPQPKCKQNTTSIQGVSPETDGTRLIGKAYTDGLFCFHGLLSEPELSRALVALVIESKGTPALMTAPGSMTTWIPASSVRTFIQAHAPDQQGHDKITIDARTALTAFKGVNSFPLSFRRSATPDRGLAMLIRLVIAVNRGATKAIAKEKELHQVLKTTTSAQIVQPWQETILDFLTLEAVRIDITGVTTDWIATHPTPPRSLFEQEGLENIVKVGEYRYKRRRGRERLSEDSGSD